MAIKGIHKEGKGTIIFATVLTIAIAVPTSMYIPFMWLQALIAATLLVFNYLVWQFFRVPVRNFLTEDNTVVCPSDGKVVVIENTHEKEFLKEDCQMVSIFMSPLNVHINWFPIAGKVIYTQYHKGKFLVAFNPKSSELNERNTVAVENKDGHKVLFRQIAGAVARRICWYTKEGDVAKQGEQFGFIKFGSRVDIFLPKSAQIKVDLEQKVVGGETVLATL